MGRSLKLKKDVYGDNNVNVANTMNCMGFVYFAAGNEEEAVRCYQEATRLWKKNESLMDIDDYISAMNDLAIIYKRRNMNIKLSACLKEIEKYSKVSKGGNIFTTHCKMGMHNLENGEIDKAKDCYFLALAAQEKDGSNIEEMSRTMRNIGTCFNAMEMYNDALKYYNYSLRSSKDLENTLVYIIMGIILSKNSNQEKALQYYKKVFNADILREGKEYDNLLLPVLNNIGNAYCELKNDRKAIDYYNKAIDNSIITPVRSRKKIKHALHSMGVLNSEASEMSNSSENFSNTYHILCGDERFDDVAAVFSNIGNAHSRQGSYLQGIHFYNKAIPLMERSLKQHKMGIILALTNLGTAISHSGDTDNALIHFEKALNMIKTKESSAENDLQTANIFKKIGYVHSKKKSYESALINYVKALELYRKILCDENHEEILHARQSIGGILRKDGRLEEALQLLEDVHAKKEKLFGGDDLQVINLILDISRIHLLRNDYKKAKTLSESALAVLVKLNLPSHHPYVRKARYALKQVGSSS